MEHQSKINEITNHPYFQVEIRKFKPDADYRPIQIWSRDKVIREMEKNSDAFIIYCGLSDNTKPMSMDDLNEEHLSDCIQIPFDAMDWNSLTS